MPPRPLHTLTPRVSIAGLTLLLIASLTLLAGMAHAQGVEFEGRPIREIQITGLDQIDSRLVENQLRSAVGRPYHKPTVEADIVRLTKLNYFSQVTALATQNDDGGIVLTYQLAELPILTGVEIRGNRAIETLQLRPLVLLRVGDPVDSVLIDRARRTILDAYQAGGYFVTDVTIDQETLDRERRLVFLIREGPQIRLREIHFEGNAAFRDKLLHKQIRAKAWIPLIGTNRVVNREELKLDAARLKRYYEDRGYLEAEVDRKITVSDNQQDGIVTFLISEGPQWTVGNIVVETADSQPLIFSPEQIKLVMDLKTGDLYASNKLNRSTRDITDLYGRLGYLNTQIVRGRAAPPYPSGVDRQFNLQTKTIDLRITILQGTSATVGKIIVRGNGVTRTKVILRELRGITPGRPFDREGFNKTQRALRESPLFHGAIITPLGQKTDAQRDVLIEVTERNTASITFGATVSSDDGLLGAIDITQRNFDITDAPESWEDFWANRAFRGAGQTFTLTLQPGSNNSRYAIGLTDPYFYDSNYFFDSSLSFSDNDRDDEYDERRTSLRLGLGKRFGDVWSASARVRAESIRIADIEDDAALDVFEVEGTNTLTGISFRVIRNTTDSNLQPTQGSRTTLSVERVGVFGGDFDYTKASVSYDKFWTVSRDFLDRKSILKLRVDGGYIFDQDEAPLFERFYAGGHTTFRGFESRGVGPRGIRADTLTLGDDAVGGDFLLLVGLEYEFPLVNNIFRGVVFTDQGLLADDITLDNWRATIGLGIRVQVPFLSQAPFAVDFAIPLTTQDSDEKRTISFAIDIPFQ